MKCPPVALLAFLVTIGLVIGCKKGPDDPLLSFKSRMGRLAGDWEVVEFTRNGQDQLYSIDTISQTPTGNCGIKIVTTEISATIKWDFDKDGDYSNRTTYRITTKTTYTEPNAGCGEQWTVQTSHTNIDGSWNFAGGAGDTKSKEYLVLADLNSQGSQYLHIVRLTSKELILEEEMEVGNQTVEYRYVFEKD